MSREKRAGEYEAPSLGRSAARGGVVTVFGQASRTAIQLASLAVLARVITPYEYGLAAMVLSIAAIANLLSDFGLSFASVQAKTISTKERSNLFWINTGLGLLLAVSIFFGSGFIAAFYGAHEVEDVAKLMSLGFLLAGATAQYRADHLRRMLFGRVVLMDVGAQCVYFAVALSVALWGGGHWALVAASISASLAMLIFMVSSAGWLPRLPAFRVSIMRFMRFGIGTLLTQLINVVSVNFNPIAIGRLLSPVAVGLYSRGFQIFSISIQQLAGPLTAVAVPILSRLQDDHIKFNEYAKQAQSVLCYVLGFSLSLVAVGGEYLVEVVLGPGWTQVGVVIQLLALGGVFQMMGQINYWIFLSKGQMLTLLYCDGLAKLGMLPIIYVATSYGLHASALSYSLGLGLAWLASTFVGLPRVGLSPRVFVAVALYPVSTYLLAVCCAIALREWIYSPNFGTISTLIFSWLSFLALILLALFVPRVRADILRMVDLLKMAMGRSRARH